MDHQARNVFLCVGCREPVQVPRGGVRTEVIEYPDGLCEIVVSVAGREMHCCAFTRSDIDIDIDIDIEG